MQHVCQSTPKPQIVPPPPPFLLPHRAQDIDAILRGQDQAYTRGSPQFKAACAAFRQAPAAVKQRMRKGSGSSEGASAGHAGVLRAAWLHFCALRALLVLTDRLGMVGEAGGSPVCCVPRCGCSLNCLGIV